MNAVTFSRGVDMTDDSIKAENIEVSDELREKISQKLDQVRGHIKQPIGIAVHLRENGGNLCHVTLHTHFQRRDLAATGEAHDFFTALTEAKDALLRQIDKIHDKNIAKRHRA